MAGFLDVVTPTTIANFAKGAWDGVSQMNPCLQMLKENADWNYDQGGDSTSDVLEGGRHTVLVSAPGMDMTPYLQARNRWARWNLPWAEIAAALNPCCTNLCRNVDEAASEKSASSKII